MAGLAVFTVSSLLDGLAWSEGSLIAFRSLQGLGAALLSPAALSILMTTFREGRERNLALGIWGAVAGSGGAVVRFTTAVISSMQGSPKTECRAFFSLSMLSRSGATKISRSSVALGRP
jgi:MFS family permease